MHPNKGREPEGGLRQAPPLQNYTTVPSGPVRASTSGRGICCRHVEYFACLLPDQAVPEEALLPDPLIPLAFVAGQLETRDALDAEILAALEISLPIDIILSQFDLPGILAEIFLYRKKQHPNPESVCERCPDC